VILVALGTHPQPMDDLLKELDRLVASGSLTETVVVQTASLRYRPSRLQTIGIVPSEELERLISAADVVISHGGPGILASVRAAGRVPVVVPRRRSAGEHIDDHQVRYASRLATEPGYVVVIDVAGLSNAIEVARTSKQATPFADASRAIEALKSITGCS
jgi:UDP-N-acetylglucosamine transferase subunit ALG13